MEGGGCWSPPGLSWTTMLGYVSGCLLLSCVWEEHTQTLSYPVAINGNCEFLQIFKTQDLIFCLSWRQDRPPPFYMVFLWLTAAARSCLGGAWNRALIWPESQGPQLLRTKAGIAVSQRFSTFLIL